MRKRATWSEESLRVAMEAVQRRQLTLRAAVIRHGIPRRTLRNHLSSGSIINRLGRRSTMNEEQEKNLVNRIIKLSNSGTPLTSKLIRIQALCEKYKLKHNFKVATGVAGKNWLKGF